MPTKQLLFFIILTYSILGKVTVFLSINYLSTYLQIFFSLLYLRIYCLPNSSSPQIRNVQRILLVPIYSNVFEQKNIYLRFYKTYNHPINLHYFQIHHKKPFRSSGGY